MVTQYDIFEFLRRHPRKWFCTKDLHKVFECRSNSISVKIRKLNIFEDIEMTRIELLSENRFAQGKGYLVRYNGKHKRV